MDWQDKTLWAVFFVTGVGISSSPFGIERLQCNTIAAFIVALAVLSFEWLKDRRKHGG